MSRGRDESVGWRFHPGSTKTSTLPAPVPFENEAVSPSSVSEVFRFSAILAKNCERARERRPTPSPLSRGVRVLLFTGVPLSGTGRPPCCLTDAYALPRRTALPFAPAERFAIASCPSRFSAWTSCTAVAFARWHSGTEARADVVRDAWTHATQTTPLIGQAHRDHHFVAFASFATNVA